MSSIVSLNDIKQENLDWIPSDFHKGKGKDSGFESEYIGFWVR